MAWCMGKNQSTTGLRSVGPVRLDRFSLTVLFVCFSTQHILTALASLWIWIFFDQNRLKEILSTSGRDDVSLDWCEDTDVKELSKTASFDKSIETFDPVFDEEEGCSFHSKLSLNVCSTGV